MADLTDGLPGRRPVRRARAVPRRLRPVLDPRPVIDAAHERGALAVVAADLLALTLLEAPGELGRRRRRRLLAALRRPDVLRRPARRLHVRRAPASSATCPAGWSASPSTPRAARRTAWPCRPASSTSAATRRPPTSAPPRCCWPSSPRCTPSTTAPRACARSRERIHRHAAVARRAARAQAGSRSSTTSSSTPSWPACPGARPRSSPARREHGLHLRLVDDDHVGAERGGDRSTARPRRRARARSASDAETDVDRRDRPTTLPGRPGPHHAVPHPRGLPHPPLRDRDAALPARGSRPATTRSTAA